MAIPWDKWEFPEYWNCSCLCGNSRILHNIVALQTCWFITVGKGPWVLGIPWGSKGSLWVYVIMFMSKNLGDDSIGSAKVSY